MEDPPRRVLINPAVCEGCGDCSVQSNCISVEPLETEMGRKRTINQSTCNKDYSCLKGFCPSFVTVDGGKLRRRAPAELGDIGELPEPASSPSLERPYNVAVGGVGGTGVLTIGALLGMAAHIEGKASMILDMSGLAQKGGAVLSHVRLSRTYRRRHLFAHRHRHRRSRDRRRRGGGRRQGDHHALRIQPHPGVINTHLIPIADFILNRDFNFQSRKVNHVLETALRKDSSVLRFHQAGRNAARRFHRHQHDDDGLCLSEGPAAAVGEGDRAGDRGQRRCDQDEHAGVPARPSRRAPIRRGWRR